MAREGIYITRSEFTALMKKIDFLEEYLINSADRVHKSIIEIQLLKEFQQRFFSSPR